MLSSVFINEGGATTGGSDEVLFIAVVSELLSVCMAFSLMLSLTTSKEVTVEVAVLLENEITLHLYVGYRETLSYTCSQTKTMHVSLYFLTLVCRQDKKEFTSSFDELSPSAIPCNEVHPPGADTFEVFLSISFSPRELFREDHPDPFLQYLSNKSLFNLHILEI